MKRGWRGRWQRGWLAGTFMSLGVGAGGCLSVAECNGDADCATGKQCKSNACVDPENPGSSSSSSAGVEVSSTSQGGTSSSAAPSSQGGTSAAVTSSSAAVSSSSQETPSCQSRCNVRSDGGHVATWSCTTGDTLADCRVASCEPGFADCTDAGVVCGTDLRGDPENCGGCGVTLGSRGTACVDGGILCGTAAGCTDPASCIAAELATGMEACCPSTLRNCAGECVDTAKDQSHCGTCGHAVDPQAGDRCSAGLESCGGSDPCGGGQWCLPSELDGGSAVCCTSPLRNCSGACEDLQTSTQHCGQCGNDLANRVDGDHCQDGLPACQDAGACQTGTRCVPDTAPYCFQCLRDEECEAPLHVCCRGVCMAPLVGCGCPESAGPVWPQEFCDPMAAGGACLLASGAVLDDLASAEDTHAGVCGCSPLASVEEARHQCQAPFGEMERLCLLMPDSNVGACHVQDDRNCGMASRECNVSLGGPTCLQVDGGAQGVCGCNPADTSPCAVIEPGVDRRHQSANTCSLLSAPDHFGHCICGASGQACAAGSAAPDCCSTGCTNLEQDPNNCGNCDGWCHPMVNDAGICGQPDAGLVPGQCGCKMGVTCPGFGMGGGGKCVLGGCVCATHRDTPCPPNTFCTTTTGCCEQPTAVWPKTCLPGGTGVTCEVDLGFPNRRSCYDVNATHHCCDNGCTAAGGCQ